jgi:hypothetical protein
METRKHRSVIVDKLAQGTTCDAVTAAGYTTNASSTLGNHASLVTASKS